MTWHAFRTTPQREMKTEQKLRLAGYDATVPKEVRYYRRHGRQKKRVSKTYALMTGYVMVKDQMSFEQREQFEIRPVPGASLHTGTISEDEIRHLEDLSGKAIAHVQSVATRQSFAIGERVTPRAGPFFALIGTVRELDQRGARVDLDIFGRPTPVWFELDSLEAV